MKQLLVNILQKLPRLYFLVYSFRFKREISAASRLIIVTTPGHVGSSTTYKSLQSIDWEYSTRIYDIHSLKERYNNNSSVNSISARHVLQEVLRKMLITGRLNNKSINIITLVRDPIARALGGLFQNPKVFLDGEYTSNYSKKEFASSCEKIRMRMLDSGYLKNTIHWQMSFYEDELSDFWGLDIYEPTNTIENGFIFQKTKNRRFLVFALEYLDEKFKEKIKYYFDKEVELVYANTYTQRKNIDTNFYSYCKHHLKFDVELANKIFDHSILKIIYPADKLIEIKNLWINKV